MTIMTHRNKIGNQSVFPIAVYMMNYKKSFISNVAVIASLIKYIQGSFPVASWHLLGVRLNIPMLKPARVSTISSRSGSVGSAQPRRSNMKRFITRKADAFNFIRARLGITDSRAKSLCFSFNNKLIFAMKACFLWFGLLSKNSPAFITTSNVSVLRYKYSEFYATYRTYFNFSFHKRIIL
jgi:hypothetical protein